MIVKQTQRGDKLFRLPITIDLYQGTSKQRQKVWANNKADTFTFNYTKRPDLINVDAEKVLLWNKKDNKTLDQFIHQYKYAGNYLDRREAIDFAAKKQDDPKAIELLKIALRDKFHVLRQHAINKADLSKDAVRIALEPVMLDLAKSDKNSLVRANAIKQLGNLEKADYSQLYKNAINDSSYTVAGNALFALEKIEPQTALSTARQLSAKPAKGALEEAILSSIVKSGDESMADKIIGDFSNMPLSQGKFNALNNLSSYLAALKNAEKVKLGVDAIVKFRDEIPEGLKNQTDPFINGMVLKSLLASKTEALKADSNNAAMTEVVNYIKSKMPEQDKKGF